MRWFVRPFHRFPKTVGLMAVFVLSMLIAGPNLPLRADPAWILSPTNIVPLPDFLYENGAFSGPWIGDLQYFDGQWLAGDGRGGIWYSSDTIRWQRAIITEQGQARRMQNAPVRSLNRGHNGTYLATFLAGGEMRIPWLQRMLGMPSRQRAPVARSTDGKHWRVREVPRSCGIHFSATNGQGTWIAQGCEDNLLVSRDDARSWSQLPTGLPPRLQAHGYFDGVWVVGAGRGEEGGIYYSSNLKTWTKAMDLPPKVAAKRSLVLNGHIIMTGSRGFVASSENGVHWTQRTGSKDAGPAMRAGVWHSQLGYILGGSGGTLMYSKDLVHWRCTTLAIGTRITGMAVSDSATAMASNMPVMLQRLVPGRLGVEAGSPACPHSMD